MASAAALLLLLLLQYLRCTLPAQASAPSAAHTVDHRPAHTALRGRYVTVEIAPVECVVTNYGAVGDGKTDDTRAIQAAFDHCGLSGGGAVVLPKGVCFFPILR